MRYDDVLADWRSVAGRVTIALGLHLSGWDGRTEAEVDGFVNPDPRHTAGTSWADLTTTRCTTRRSGSSASPCARR
ncbi:MAG: hypothetical protein M3548_18585, partial [Actinomycetota bacterium]|nr:hypothetical protein [Actinomycetota bacterium]